MRVHDLRHTHVALLIDQGEKPIAIAKRIGHFDVAFTMSRYGHLLRGQEESFAERLERLAPGVREPDSNVVAINS